MTTDTKFGTNKLDPAPPDAALLRVLKQIEDNGALLHDAKIRVVALEQRGDILRQLARSYLAELSEESRKTFIDAHAWLTPGISPAPRGVFLNAIVQLFLSDQNRVWTTPEINIELEKQGIHVESKRIFNTLNYLAADSRIERLVRGQYRASADLQRYDASRIEEDIP
jgi:hypothetical protein